jgi:hypothetical protein
MKMKKRWVVGILPLVGALLIAGVVLAVTLVPHSGRANGANGPSQAALAQLERPHTASQLSADNHARLVFHCDVASGATPVVDVQQFVTGDADSGFQGAWAYDTLKRSIQVWSLGNSTYCADVNYEGTFTAIAGATSPGIGSTNILTGNETGHFFGGYVSTIFQGQLNIADPSHWPAHGLVRPKPVDYQCDTSFNCPGAVFWADKYFTNLTGFDLADWGWRYFASDPANGSWTNAAAGSFGDII